MAAILTVPTIIKIANISQYLAAIDIANKNNFQGGSIDQRNAKVIFLEKKALQNRYNLNPNDPTLIDTANYVFALCGPYNIQAQNIISQQTQSKPIVTGPTNQSVLVGATATFTVTVTSSISYVTQWYLNGIIIPGATGNSYQVTNAQLSQSGGIYSAIVTNGAGSTSSTSATLTVTNSLTGYLYYSSIDPGPILRGSSDPFAYQNSFSITHNAPWSITIPSGATPNMFLVFKGPSAESIKTTWANGTFNSGNIPDAIFQTYLQFGGETYYYTRVTATFDATQLLTLT